MHASVKVILSVGLALTLPQSSLAIDLDEDCGVLLVGDEPRVTLLDLFQDSQIQSLLSDGSSIQVLADALIERGHSYGEFLGLWSGYQGALQRGDSEEVGRIHTQIQSLLAREMESWVPREFLASLQSFIFHEDGRVRGMNLRGGPELSQFFSRGGTQFMQLMKMDRIEINGWNSGRIPLDPKWLKELRQVSSLNSLNLDGVSFESARDIRALSQFTDLREFGLSIRGDRSERIPGHADIIFQSIAKMTRLQTLLVGYVLSCDGMDQLSALKELTELSVTYCGGTRRTLYALEQFPKLRKLIFDEVSFSGGRVRSTQSLHFPFLTHLGVRASRIARSDLSKLLANPSLTHVDLDEQSAETEARAGYWKTGNFPYTGGLWKNEYDFPLYRRQWRNPVYPHGPDL